MTLSTMVCEDSVKTVLIFLLAYAMGIGVYFSTRRNYRRREEHGSAKWGNAGALNKKYRDKDPSANKLLTQNVRIGLDGKKHRRNLNILVCGGSGAGKTRFFCKPNAMQCNTSFVILDPSSLDYRKKAFVPVCGAEISADGRIEYSPAIWCTEDRCPAYPHNREPCSVYPVPCAGNLP